MQRLVSWSVERLKKEGYCVTGLSASFRRPDRFGRQVVSLCLGEGIPLPPHRFQYVLYFRYLCPFEKGILVSLRHSLKHPFQSWYSGHGFASEPINGLQRDNHCLSRYPIVGRILGQGGIFERRKMEVRKASSPRSYLNETTMVDWTLVNQAPSSTACALP